MMTGLLKASYHTRSIWLEQQLLTDIRAGKYGTGTLLPAEQELAARYRVSRPTVRRAVEGLISQGHVRRLPQRGVMITVGAGKEARIAQVAFITAALTGDTHPYVQGMTAGIDNDRFTLAPFSTQANLPKYQEMIGKVVNLRPAGIIVESLPEELCRIDGRAISESGIPCVTLDAHPIPGLNCDRVTSSAFENGRLAAMRAVEAGYRDIAVVTIPPVRTNQPMLQGMRSVLEPAGIELGDDRVIYCESPHGYASPPDPCIDVQRCVARLIKRGFRCEAILAGHDYPAVGVIRALLEAGIRVPQEVKVVSAMRCAVEGFVPLRITTVDVLRENQGRAAAELLMRRIDGHDGPPEVHYVASRLVEGETG